MNIIRAWLTALAPVLVGFNLIAPSAMAADPHVPEPLAPWVQWVMDDDPGALCTWRHDAEEIASCYWPGRLSLDLGPAGGKFEQRWTIEKTAWVPLPGSPEHWPAEVRANDEPVLVADREGVPSLRLEPGDYDVRGVFRWEDLPVSLPVSRDTAMIRLALSGEVVSGLVRDDRGAITLRQVSSQVGDRANRLDVALFRRLIDERPFQVHTRLSLDVSGNAREIVLPDPFLSGAEPLRLEGPLPIRLLADRRIQIQVRPGRYEFDLFSRLPGKVGEVRRGAVELPLPTQEVWSFDARRTLRDVRPEGLAAIDPRQTRMPDDWHDLPAFVAGPDALLQLEETARTEAIEPRDQLSLERELWLDFDGMGFTVRDRIRGVVHGGERLEMGGAPRLGRVVLNGEPQFITRLEGRQRHGVEVRPGPIDLSADARVDSAGELPVSGWNRDLRSVESTLHLPPGWRLLAATGAETVETAWIGAWSMLDMFMVLVLSAAIFRVWGPWPGLLALLALVLSWQSTGAPQYVWVPLVATSALVDRLAAGRLRAWVVSLRLVSILAVVVVTTPFLVHTARTMLFPQLEHAERVFPAPVGVAYRQAGVEEMRMAAESEPPVADLARSAKITAMPAPPPQSSVQQAPVRSLDTALIQTGPGVPEWTWNRYRLEWNGPVDAEQSFTLVVLPPLANRGLDLLRVLLVAGLAALLIVGRAGRGNAGRGASKVAVAWLVAPMAGLMMIAADRAAADFPPDALLKELRDRVIQSPDCLPHCVTLESVLVTAGEDDIRVFFELSVLEEVAVPLLESSAAFSPTAIEIDGAPATMLGQKGGALVPLETGSRLVEISGPVGEVEEILLTFPIRPHRLAVESSAWRSSGMERPGGSDRQLRLYRTLERGEAPEQAGTATAAGLVAPFFELTRTIVLETDARVFNELRRLSDPRAPVALDVPLIDGESPLTGVVVRDGTVRASFAAGQTTFRWESVLDLENPLVLVAPEDAGRVERWRLDASTRWHVRHEGVPPVLAGGEDGPVKVWRPWPGERLALTLIKPDGVEGDTLTIDRSKLYVTPGSQAMRVRLSSSLRSSRGGSHTLTLPEDARIQHFRLDGEVQPFDPAASEVRVALRPGTRHVDLEWLQGGEMTEVFHTPEVDLNLASVNATVELEPDRDRWILWVHGPLMGPAVLYWGLLAVVLLISIGLARIGWLPVAWWQWFLLGAGISHSSLWYALPVVAWFLLIGYRRGLTGETRKSLFNACQAAIVVLTPVMLVALVAAVETGLLGSPDMQISGNHSGAAMLSWYQDRVDSVLPQAMVVSVPLLAYRLLMLAWSLWLAFVLIRWLRWGWYAFASDGYWRRIQWRRPRDAST